MNHNASRDGWADGPSAPTQSSSPSPVSSGGWPPEGVESSPQTPWGAPSGASGQSPQAQWSSANFQTPAALGKRRIGLGVAVVVCGLLVSLIFGIVGVMGFVRAVNDTQDLGREGSFVAEHGGEVTYYIEGLFDVDSGVVRESRLSIIDSSGRPVPVYSALDAKFEVNSSGRHLIAAFEGKLRKGEQYTASFTSERSDIWLSVGPKLLVFERFVPLLIAGLVALVGIVLGVIIMLTRKKPAVAN